MFIIIMLILVQMFQVIISSPALFSRITNFRSLAFATVNRRQHQPKPGASVVTELIFTPNWSPLSHTLIPLSPTINDGLASTHCNLRTSTKWRPQLSTLQLREQAPKAPSHRSPPTHPEKRISSALSNLNQMAIRKPSRADLEELQLS